MKKAQFSVDIIGIPQVKRAVQDYAKEYLRQEAKITRQVETESRNRQRILREELDLRKQINQQSASHTSKQGALSYLGHLAQAAGFYRTGHMLRAASMMGVGSSSGAAGMGSAAVGLSAAFAGVVVASKLVEVGFQSVSKVVGDFVGALGKIGGAKDLQSMIVESVSNVKLANQARFAVSPKERLSSGELNLMAGQLSTNASAGAFSKDEWLKAFGNIGTISGKQASLGRKDMEFIGQFANIHGMELGEASNVFGRLQAQNPSWSTGQVRQSLLAGFGAGQTLSFNPSELPEANTLMRQTEFLKGDSQANLQKLLVAGGLVKPAAGGMQNAGVQIQNMLKGFRQHGITDLDTILGRVATSPISQLPIKDIRGQNAAVALQAQLSERAGVSKEDFTQAANEARMKELKTLEGVTMTEEEFKKAVEESISPQEQLKAIFNDLANELEGKFLEVVKEAVPVVRMFADAIIAHKDDIKDYGDKLVAWLATAVEIMPGLVSAIANVISAIGDAAMWLISLIPGHASSLEDARSKFQDAEATSQERFMPGSRTEKTQQDRDRDAANLAAAQKELDLWQSIAGAKAATAGAPGNYDDMLKKIEEREKYNEAEDWLNKRKSDHISHNKDAPTSIQQDAQITATQKVEQAVRDLIKLQSANQGRN